MKKKDAKEKKSKKKKSKDKQLQLNPGDSLRKAITKIQTLQEKYADFGARDTASQKSYLQFLHTLYVSKIKEQEVNLTEVSMFNWKLHEKEKSDEASAKLTKALLRLTKETLVEKDLSIVKTIFETLLGPLDAPEEAKVTLTVPTKVLEVPEFKKLAKFVDEIGPMVETIHSVATKYFPDGVPTDRSSYESLFQWLDFLPRLKPVKLPHATSLKQIASIAHSKDFAPKKIYLGAEYFAYVGNDSSIIYDFEGKEIARYKEVVLQWLTNSTELLCLVNRDSLSIKDATKESARITFEKPPLRNIHDHITEVAFTKDHKKLAAGTFHGDVFVWDCKTGKLLETFLRTGLSVGRNVRLIGFAGHNLYTVDDAYGLIRRTAKGEEVLFSSSNSHRWFCIDTVSVGLREATQELEVWKINTKEKPHYFPSIPIWTTTLDHHHFLWTFGEVHSGHASFQDRPSQESIGGALSCIELSTGKILRVATIATNDSLNGRLYSISPNERRVAISGNTSKDSPDQFVQI